MFANRKTKRVNHYANIVTKVIFVQKKFLTMFFKIIIMTLKNYDKKIFK